ncbi:MFS transporter [Enterococcus faecalis]|nr:MFS transporter [Enterococcus faecalis]
MNENTVGITAQKKVRWHILPYLFLIYFVAFLDRSSITYASLGGMDDALGLTATMYGFIAGIFFIGYFLFGIPGNMMLEKVGAKKWISLILVLWGAVTLLTGYVQSATELTILRFLLGTFEAALFPGMTLIVTYWFLNKTRAAAIALFMIAPPLANAFGAPVATAIITQIHQFLGLDGWRWLFIIVGLPAILLGFFTYWYLNDDPSKAKWLTTEEKQWLTKELDKDRLKSSKHGEISAPFKEALLDKKIWIVTLMNIFYVMGLYGITFWLPQMIRGISKNSSTMAIGWFTAVPYLLGSVALVLNAKSSDKTGERIYHTASGAIIGGVSLFISASVTNVYLSLFFICIAAMGLYAWSGPYWAITTDIDPRIAAVGLGIVNALGNLGGFISPYIVGWLKDMSNSTVSGMYFLSASLIIAGCLVMLLKKKETK